MTGVEWNAVGGGFVFLLVGLAIAGGIGYTEYRDYQIRDEFRETTAEFVHGAVERDRRLRGDTWRTVYVAQVSYAYTVDGTRYEGRESWSHDSASEAERSVARASDRYPSTVYYHPDAPDESFTSDPGEPSGVLLGVVFGGIFVYLGGKSILEGVSAEVDAE